MPSVMIVTLYKNANGIHVSQNWRLCPVAPCMLCVLYNLPEKS